MKVRELLEELSKCDMNAPVWAHVYLTNESAEPFARILESMGVVDITIDNAKRPIINIAPIVA